MERLQPAVLQMCDAVERFGGTVVRTLGDGIMALFGVPRALEGHARLACEAALRIQAIFLNDTQGLSVRVGIHTGQVASNPAVGDSARGSGVHGLTIHLASRVMASADPGGICITDACQVQVREHYEVQALGLFALKGISGQTELYTLLHGKLEASSAKHSTRTPFRGRDREMGLLQLALHRASNGNAPVVGVSGEPGTGKSRICYEFAQWCRGRGVAVHEVRAQLYGHATPLQPVLELLRGCFFHIAHGDDAATARGKIAQRLALPGSNDATPLTDADSALLSDFLGVADPDIQVPALSPRARHARLLVIVRQLVRQPGNGVTLLLLEDLHWLDEASMDFVATLVDAMLGTRMLLVLNYRPTFKANWQAATHFQKIELTELSSEDTSQIVRELISHRRELLDICELIARRSGGNPFFAEELVRSLAESGALSGEPGPSRNSIDSIARALPSNVQSVVGARIDRLGELDKALLQMCAIIGKEIPLVVLERVAGPAIADVANGLEQLCAAELMQPQPDEDGPRFAFRHPLIQEVAYSTQLKARRTALHAAVAAAMDDHYKHRGDEFAALVAHHYEAAGQLLNAAMHESRAARWMAATNSALGIRHWRKVRVLLKDQPRSPQVDGLRALAGGRIVYLGWREGLSLQEVQLIIDESMELASEADTRLVQLLLFAHGRMLQSSGGTADGYVESVKKALALDAQRTDAGRSAMLNVALSHAYAWSGLLTQGLEASDLALPELSKIDTFDREFIGFSVEQWALSIRVRLLNRMCRFDEAHALLRQMSEGISPSDDPVMRQIAHHVYVDLAWCLNDAELARRHSVHVAGIAAGNSSPYSQVFALSCSGLSDLVSLEFNQARQTFTSALKLIREINVAAEFEAEVLAGLAESCYALERFDESLLHAEEALATSRRQCNRVSECRALIVLGASLAHRDQIERANTVLAQAEQLIHMTGAKVFAKSLQRARDRCVMPIV